MDSLKLKNLALFAGGVLFGTAGVKILSSKDVKKVYVEDILAEAKQINERRAAEEAASVQEDTVEDHADPETEEA